jgi:hypothetical protein
MPPVDGAKSGPARPARIAGNGETDVRDELGVDAAFDRTSRTGHSVARAGMPAHDATDDGRAPDLVG